MTRKFGYHHIMLPDGHTEDCVVIEVNEEGLYVSHHKLTEEEPFVEWVGGTYCVS